MIDVAALTAFLAPALPYLLDAGERTARAAAEALGEGAWRVAQDLWGRLRGAVDGREAAREAAEDVAAQPDDEDARVALKRQLEKLLAADDRLAAEVEARFATAQQQGVVSVVVGTRGVGSGGDITGSTIITGDSSTARGPE